MPPNGHTVNLEMGFKELLELDSFAFFKYGYDKDSQSY